METWPILDEEKEAEYENTTDPLYNHFREETEFCNDHWYNDYFDDAPIITPGDMGFENGKNGVADSGSGITADSGSSGSGIKIDYSNYFHLTFKETAKLFKVRETQFRKMIRLQGIDRWPYGKSKSLQTVINHSKEMGKDTDLLEEEKKTLMNNPNMELSKEAKILAKALDKKRRRLLKKKGDEEGRVL